MSKKLGHSINDRQKLMLELLRNSTGLTEVEINKYLLSHGQHSSNVARDFSEIRASLGLSREIIKAVYRGKSENGASVFVWQYNVPEPVTQGGQYLLV